MTGRGLEALLSPEVVAVRIVGRDWPARPLRPTVVPDSWIGLVASKSGRRRFVVSGENPRAADSDEILLVRNRPIETPLKLVDEPAGDGVLVSGSCLALVRWQAREDDLDALRRWMTGAVLRLDDLAQALAAGGGRNALRTLIRGFPVEKLVHEDQREALAAALNEHLKRWLFESGAVIEHVAQVIFRSEELQRSLGRRRETAEKLAQVEARQQIEQAAAQAAKSRLEFLGDLSKRLKTLSDSGAGSWSQVLAALNPLERGNLLQNLWRISAPEQAAANVAAVCGDALLLIDARTGEDHAQVRLPTSLGGLRSARFDAAGNRLLIGAARGVWVIDAHTLNLPVAFEAPTNAPVQTGFNAAAITGQCLVATHSQLGCWMWPLAAPARGRCVLDAAPGQSVRAVLAAPDGRVFLAVNDFVYALDAESGAVQTLVGLGDEILALALDRDRFVAGLRDGRAVTGPLNSPELVETLHRARLPIESVSVRRFNEVREVVLPAGPQGVIAVHGEDGIITPLMNGAPVRKAWTGPGLIVALTHARDRLVISTASAAANLEVLLARRLGASIQDVAIVSHESRITPDVG